MTLGCSGDTNGATASVTLTASASSSTEANSTGTRRAVDELVLVSQNLGTLNVISLAPINNEGAAGSILDSLSNVIRSPAPIGGLTDDNLLLSLQIVDRCVDAIRILSAPTINEDTGNLFVSVFDDLILASRFASATVRATVTTTIEMMRIKIGQVVSGMLTVGESKIYGDLSQCTLVKMQKINPGTTVSEYSVSLGNCATFTIPYGALPAQAKTLTSSLIQAGSMSPLVTDPPAGTAFGSFLSRSYLVGLFEGNSGQAIPMPALTAQNKISISTTLTDARECTGVTMNTSTATWNTTNGVTNVPQVTCSANGVDNGARFPQAAQVSLRASSSGIFAAVQGAITILYNDTELTTAYRTCMIAANYVEADMLACRATLLDTLAGAVNCAHKSTSDCDFAKQQAFNHLKKRAAGDERTARIAACRASACAAATCTDGYVGNCAACTTCKAGAQAFYELVKGVQACTTTCTTSDGIDDTIANQGTARDSLTKAMGECATGRPIACARADLEVSLSEVLNDQQVYAYIFASAEEALALEMEECTDLETLQSAFTTCKTVNGKASLAASLGMSDTEVTAPVLNEYLRKAAIFKTGLYVQSCMAAANSSDQRGICIHGDDAKTALGGILGVISENLSDGLLEEFVIDAAVARGIEVIDACMDNIASVLTTADTAAARTQCRATEGCAALAPYLGFLSTELSQSDCYKYLNAATQLNMQSKMASCIAAINSTLSDTDQASARNTCKTVTLKAAMAKANGEDVSDITNERLQRSVTEAALVMTMPSMMSACMAAIGDDDTLSDDAKQIERNTCRTTAAKTAYAEATGLSENDISTEELTEALDSAAEATTRSAMKACPSLTNSTEKAACIAAAKIKAAATLGLENITDTVFAELQLTGALNEMREVAAACAEANTSVCDFQSSFDSAAGTNSTSLSATEYNTTQRKNTRAAAKHLIKLNLKSCYGSTNSQGATRSQAEIATCAQGLDLSTFELLEGIDRMEMIIRDAIQEIASERMVACMQSLANATSCQIGAKVLMQAYYDGIVDDPSLVDAFLLGRAAKYTSAKGTTEACSGASDSTACVAGVAAEATSNGGTSEGARIDEFFNALKEAALIWTSCDDTAGAGTDDCEMLAKTQFITMGGNLEEWQSSERDQARDIADGLSNGNLTAIFRSASADLVLSFPDACSNLDTVAANTDIISIVAGLDDNLEVYQVSDFWEETALTCVIKYRVELGSSSYTIDSLLTELKAIVLTATNIDTRRSVTTTASTSTAQTVSECTSTCTLATPSTAPTSNAPTTVQPTNQPTAEPTIEGDMTNTTLIYQLSNSNLTVAAMAVGTVPNTAASLAFAGVAGIQPARVSLPLVTVASRRTVSLNLHFFVTQSTNLDISAITSAMIDTSSSGFANSFVLKAAALGQMISLPTVQFVSSNVQSASSDSSSSSFDFPVWAAVIVPCIAILIALGVFVFVYKKNKAENDQLKAEEFKKQTADSDSKADTFKSNDKSADDFDPVSTDSSQTATSPYQDCIEPATDTQIELVVQDERLSASTRLPVARKARAPVA